MVHKYHHLGGGRVGRAHSNDVIMMLCTHQRHKQHKEPGIDVEISSSPFNDKDEAPSDEGNQDALQ